MKDLVGSSVMFEHSGLAIRGAVVGFHNNLGMFKIESEAGKDYFVKPEAVLFGRKDMSKKTITEGSVVEISPKHLKDNFGLGIGHYVGSKLNTIRLFGVVEGLEKIEGRDTARIVNITENKVPDNDKNTHESEFVYVENISVCSEEIDFTEEEQEDVSVIEEGDFVVIKASNLNSWYEVHDELVDLTRAESLAGSVECIDYSDDTALVVGLCNLKTKQLVERHLGEQWVSLKDLKKVSKSFEETDTLVTKINKWGTDRNITLEGGTTPQKQVSKLVEEVAECIEALDDLTLGVDGAEDKLKDAYGDMLVCIIQAIRLSGMDFNDCLNVAYNEIKDRKGTMVNGKFVKES